LRFKFDFIGVLYCGHKSVTRVKNDKLFVKCVLFSSYELSSLTGRDYVKKDWNNSLQMCTDCAGEWP
jgi:hypothetical protein